MLHNALTNGRLRLRVTLNPIFILTFLSMILMLYVIS